jgi:EAL domain-containing protein (putative c-di-GMP-specific phosphodiesterase class I)/GGDEF domain-containing protein
MRLAPVIARTLRRPRGLAARAVVFTTCLIALTALLSAATLLFGAERESARHQLGLATDYSRWLADGAGDMLADDRAGMLAGIVEIGASREGVRRLAIRGLDGRVIAESGRSVEDRALIDAVAAQVRSSGRQQHIRRGDGVLAVGAPIIHDGSVYGVSVLVWAKDANRFNALPSLTPFLLILMSLAVTAIPLTARAVRKAIAPLDVLAAYAERIAERGEAAKIDIKSGDEFETLANAFNKMTSRLDASIRHIQHVAFVDPATRLSNQERFVREVDFFILKNGGQQTGAVVIFDLLRLPRLMQTLSPEASRDYLRVIADRLTAHARAADHELRHANAERAPVLAARLGVAEFAVFAPFVSPADALRLAQRLNASLNEPFDWRGHKFILGACCGVALAPRDGADADAVIRHARLALGAAQAAPARVKAFTPSLDRQAVARLTLEREMRIALEQNEFRAYFQPKINLATGRIEACEALARWIRPDRTIISPGRFIPVAEESGLIIPLSEAIMREACWKAAAWARAGYPAKVAVNVSALQFHNDRFAEQVLRILQHAGLAPEQLELEITESMVMEDPDRAVRAIQPLREAGVRFAIDDFGCGHSSLAALSKLPFDVIKIDQQFVRALDRGEPQSEAIVDMILALGRTLGMEIVAEGVERREDVEFMAARGCHWVQGFFFGAAAPAQEFAEMLRRQASEDRQAGEESAVAANAA